MPESLANASQIKHKLLTLTMIILLLKLQSGFAQETSDNLTLPQNMDVETSSQNLDAPKSRWAGAYVGLQIGGGAGSSLRYFSQNGYSAGNFGVNSILGGFTLGYNQQFTKLIAGLDTNFSANSMNSNSHFIAHNERYATSNPWLSTFRVKLGYDFDSFMPYVFSGLAVGREHISTVNSLTGLIGSDYSHPAVGWVLGTGIEKAISSQLSLKAEYQYVQFNRVEGASSTGFPTYTSLNESIAVVGLNYKFDPLSARSPTTSLATEMSAPLSLTTETAVELGAQISDYRYEERAGKQIDFVHETGAKYGFTALANKAFVNNLFITGDFRFAYSSNNYASPGGGRKQNIPDYLWDTRIIMGKDFVFEQLNGVPVDFSLAPYIGIGYRNLLNDSRGITSIGKRGYRRDSEYLYIPIGVTHRFLLDDSSRISTNIEYDQLVEGWQTSYLNDFSAQQVNIVNGQYSGYGLRGNLNYERANWSAGPFFYYWNINRSDLARGAGNSEWLEPHNDTLEYGLQARYRF